MYKKISTWIVFLVLLMILIFTILFGSILVHYYEYGPRFPKLQKILINIASVPINFENIIKYGSGLRPSEKKFQIKKDENGIYLRFYIYNNKTRDALLVLPEYDAEKKRSIVKIIDLKSFKTIHTYNLDIEKIYNNLNVSYWGQVSRDNNSNERFVFGHPAVLSDGSLIGKNVLHSPLFKINICGKKEWVNNKNNISFHHSIELNENENIWVSGTLRENSNFNKSLKISRPNLSYINDAMILIDSRNGDILFQKSILDLLIENNLIYDSDRMAYQDIIHINDIQPVLKSTNFMKKGDVFISIRTLSAIIHYRPSENKIINYIKGPFIKQHDVDIIAHNEISIFNNNETFLKKNYSEIIVYNLEKKKFARLNNEGFVLNNIYSKTEGLVDFLSDGSYMVEETNHARLLFFDKEGGLDWIYLNVANDGLNYPITWSRIIDNKKLINDIKKAIIGKEC